MEVFMRILAWTVPFIVMLTMTLAWPTVGEAQSNKSSARKAVAVQKQAQRPVAKTTKRRAMQRNCAGHTWWGCTGWDPDPNIRGMLARDVGDDN
jgi:hypothetical protein